MKKLTVEEDFSKQIRWEDFDVFEEKYSILVPDNLKRFLLDYAGSSVSENVCHKKEKDLFFPIQRFLFLMTNDKHTASIDRIFGGLMELGIKNFIPFAIDPGGYSYCMSIDRNTCGQIWVFCYDNNEENPFCFVAITLEEFIELLITESEAIKLGY